MTGPTTLPLHCPHCGGAVTVQYEEWDNEAEQETTSYPCPWCGKGFEFQAPGRFGSGSVCINPI